MTERPHYLTFAAGVDTTVVTYNTLIDACVSAGEPTEAMFGVLSALVAAGHRPDVVGTGA